MNVTERKSLLDSRDNTILSAVVKADDLKQQLLADQLNLRSYPKLFALTISC